MIDIVDVTKSYGQVVALTELSMHIKEGIFGLVGPNGSGKTTLIKILIGAVRPDKGRVSIFGRDCWRESLEVRRLVGVMHERVSFPKEATGISYLTFIGCLHGLPKTEAKATAIELLSWVGLAEAAHRDIGGYSAGMKQRLNFAQALIGRPELVLLDEPTANLDPLARMGLLKKVKELHKEYDMNFFISSHVLPELEEVCEQVGIIYRGTLIEQGRLDELAKKYFANTFKIITPEPKALLNKIQDLSVLRDVHINGAALIVKVGDPNKFYSAITQATSGSGKQPRIIQVSGDRLKEVYKAIVKIKED